MISRVISLTFFTIKVLGLLEPFVRGTVIVVWLKIHDSLGSLLDTKR